MNHGKLHLLVSEMSIMLELGTVWNKSSNFHREWVPLCYKLFCMLSGTRPAASLSDFESMCIDRQSHRPLVSGVRFLLKTRNHDVSKLGRAPRAQEVPLREAGVWVSPDSSRTWLWGKEPCLSHLDARWQGSPDLACPAENQHRCSMYACGSPHDVALGVQKMCWVSTLCVGDSEMKKLGSGFEETGRGMGEYPGGSDEVVTVAPGKCQQRRERGSWCWARGASWSWSWTRQLFLPYAKGAVQQAQCRLSASPGIRDWSLVAPSVGKGEEHHQTCTGIIVTTFFGLLKRYTKIPPEWTCLGLNCVSARIHVLKSSLKDLRMWLYWRHGL